MVEQRHKVDASLAPGVLPIDVNIVGPVPVPVAIPLPVPVVGEAGPGDPVLVEGIAGGVPVPVVAEMVPSMDWRDIQVPALPNGLLGWINVVNTAIPGRVIMQIDNRAIIGAGYGLDAIELYLDLELMDNKAGVSMYSVGPWVPTHVVPANTKMTFEIDSYLSGVKLDLSQFYRFRLELWSVGAATRCHAFIRNNGPCAITWMGLVI